MGQNGKAFDENWRALAAGGRLGESWANEVVIALKADGGRYLDTLALWFERFPVTSEKDRWALKARLESFTTSDHLGAANELSWYEFMRQAGLQAQPIPPAKAARPDFRVTSPTDFFVEVSTLNVSEAEKRDLQATGGVALNHGETLRRLLLKASDEKRAQFEYAASESLPCLLVLFDYTYWSGLATGFFRFLATALLEEPFGFDQFPVVLSGIVYAERRVFTGRIVLSRQRSAIYFNPAARYPLPVEAFDMLRQFGSYRGETEPRAQGDWIEL